MATQVVVTCQPDRSTTQVHVTDLFPGLYDVAGTHEGKPLYRKMCPQIPHGSLALYYWTDTTNPALSGWWLGPVVGGSEVWAFCQGDDALPPEQGWRHPHDCAIDETMVVSKGGFLCSYEDRQGRGCLDLKPVCHPLCINAMCRQHCLQQGVWCPRHNSVWQAEQDAKKRGQRANRRRGGKRARDGRDAYEITS
jgi:hypothetical protein